MPDRKEDRMSHVDEGTLHAYLDGELPSGDRAALEAHVAQCATCRAALTDERALRDRASAVLGRARPLERPAPPFEQIRRTPARLRWRVRMPFAWAASIALALGIGYLLRSPNQSVVASDKQGPTAEPTVVATNRTTGAPLQEQKAAAPVQVRGTRRTTRAPTDEIDRVRESQAPPSDVASSAEARNSAPSPTPAARRVSDSVGLDQLNDSLLRERLKTAHLETVVVTGAAVPTAAKSERGATTGWGVISRDVARSLLGQQPVGLPGLPIRAIRRGLGSGAVVVEQALDSSSVIQIIQRPAGSGLQDSLSSGFGARAYRQRADHLLARFIGRLRVEITGPVSVDSLNRLLEQVQPLP